MTRLSTVATALRTLFVLVAGAGLVAGCGSKPVPHASPAASAEGVPTDTNGVAHGTATGGKHGSKTGPGMGGGDRSAMGEKTGAGGHKHGSGKGAGSGGGDKSGTGKNGTGHTAHSNGEGDGSGGGPESP